MFFLTQHRLQWWWKMPWGWAMYPTWTKFAPNIFNIDFHPIFFFIQYQFLSNIPFSNILHLRVGSLSRLDQVCTHYSFSSNIHCHSIFCFIQYYFLSNIPYSNISMQYIQFAIMLHAIVVYSICDTIWNYAICITQSEIMPLEIRHYATCRQRRMWWTLSPDPLALQWQVSKMMTKAKPLLRILAVQPEFCCKGGVETPCQMGCGSSLVNINHYWETKLASYFTIIYRDLHQNTI